MITYYLWNIIVFDNFDWTIRKKIYLSNIFTAVFVSIFTLIVDIILFPIELISFIIYIILNKEK